MSASAIRPYGRTMRVAHEVAKAQIGEIIAPRELIEDVKYERRRSPRLAPRRCLFLLIQAAGGDAWQDIVHRVSKADLGLERRSRDEVDALLKAVDEIRVAIPALSGRERLAISYGGLFDHLYMELDRGPEAAIEFRFRAELRSLFAASKEYAVLRREALSRLECRYAITLYALGCLFISRKRPAITVKPEEMIDLLGMPDLTLWAEIERAALLPAQAELAVWAHFQMSWETEPRSPRGRARVRRVTLRFEAKDGAIEAVDGQDFVAVDRKSRRAAKKRAITEIAAAEADRDRQLRHGMVKGIETARAADLAADLQDEIPY